MTESINYLQPRSKNDPNVGSDSMKINNIYLAIAIVYSVAVKLITYPNVGLSLKNNPFGVLVDFFLTIIITYAVLILINRVVTSQRVRALKEKFLT